MPEFLPQLLRSLAANAGQQLHQSFEGKLVARIQHQFQIGRHIFDMRLLEEANAAGDAERDVAPRQFELQFQRVKM